MLELRRLEAGYGGQAVLTNVTLTLAKGEVLGVLGRNGAGKSTLVKAIVGLTPQVGGEVWFRDLEMCGRSTHEIARSGVALVPQGRWIFPRLTVHENLMTAHRGTKEDARMVLQQVFQYFPVLAQRSAQMGGTLSGGEQQMLAIGRALCGRPHVLLLDEPSDGVQPSIVEKLGEVIPSMCKAMGISAILVEQNLDLVLGAASRCVVLARGEIVFEGNPRSLDDVRVFEKHLSV